MKKVTKQNMLRYLDMREEYKQTHDKELLKEINKFIDEANLKVIILVAIK